MTYQGHKNYNHWNVSLYMANDYPLYQLANACVNDCDTLDQAADEFMSLVQGFVSDGVEMRDGHAFTADGVKFTKTTVRAALRYWNQ